MSSNAPATQIDYDQLEMVRAAEVQDDLTRKLEAVKNKDTGGQIDSLRRTILNLVVTQEYEVARDELKGYVEGKSEFTVFQERVERYVAHGCELIQAIQTKRNFPGLSSLSLSKQQEIHEKVLDHFEELKQYLRRIEKVERDHKLSDLRSTAWVVRTLSHSILILVAAGFLRELHGNMWGSFEIVFDALVNDLTNSISSLLKL